MKYVITGKTEIQEGQTIFTMGGKSKFSKPTNFRAVFSGWSDTKCKLCKKTITNAQKKYSLENFKKPLCKHCQMLEKMSA